MLTNMDILVLPPLKKIKHIIALSLISIFLTACAKQQIADSASIHSAAIAQADKEQVDANSIIKELEEAISKAKADELDFYSPVHLDNAQDEIDKAKSFLENPSEDKPNAASASAIAAKSIIEKAYENKALVIEYLQDALANKKILDDLEVNLNFKKDYEEAMEALKELITEIETGKIKEAIQGQPDVIKEMAQLEIRFLQHKHLKRAEQFRKKAYEVNADDYAPASFKNALSVLEQSNQYIRENNRNSKGVEKAGNDAFIAMQRAYYTAIDAKLLVNMSSEKAEQHALDLINKLNHINLPLSNETLLPQSYQTALERLANKATIAQSQLHETKRLLADAQKSERALKEQLHEKQSEPQKLETSIELSDAEWLRPVQDHSAGEQDHTAAEQVSAFELMEDE